MNSRVLYTKPSITKKEIEYVNDAVRNSWGEHCYEYIKRFEAMFRHYLGVNYAIATSSCTGALHMGLSALGVGTGDEVIIGDTNWIASAAPINYLGAKPVFVDVLPDSWCLNPDLVEQAITSKTKAIIAVHLYGNLCDMDSLMMIGNKYGIPVIEDAAEAIGSKYYGKHAGSIGKFSTFSFHGSKTITTGEGGMFVTNDKKLYEQVLTLSNHGRDKEQVKQFYSEVIGFKYKMTDLQAAIGCAQMERIEALITKKREIFTSYANGLSNLPLKMNIEPNDQSNGYWMPTIVVDDGVHFDRDKLLTEFKENNIDGRVFFCPLSSLPMYESKPENNNSYGLYKRGLNLPSYHDLSMKDINRVINLINDFL